MRRIGRLPKTIAVLVGAGVLAGGIYQGTTGGGSSSSSAKAACTTTVAFASVGAALTAASTGDVVCITAGSYGALTISAAKSGNVTVQSPQGGAVTVAGIGFSSTATHVIASDFTSTSGVDFANGSSDNQILYSDLTSTGNIVTQETGSSNVTISHNKIHGCGPTSTTGLACNEDGIRVHTLANITITYNSIYDVIEDPTGTEHNDGIQLFLSGNTGLFNHNYFHDNCAQNLFIKDGTYTGITITDNLFLRDDTVPAGGCLTGSHAVQVFQASGSVLRNNTDWTGTDATLLRCDPGQGGNTATVDHNVFGQFENSPGDSCSWTLTESFNIFGQTPFTFTPAGTDSTNASPGFTNTATDDYRLSSNPNSIGVDWKPADYTYGPRS